MKPWQVWTLTSLASVRIWIPYLGNNKDSMEFYKKEVHDLDQKADGKPSGLREESTALFEF